MQQPLQCGAVPMPNAPVLHRASGKAVLPPSQYKGVCGPTRPPNRLKGSCGAREVLGAGSSVRSLSAVKPSPFPPFASEEDAGAALGAGTCVPSSRGPRFVPGQCLPRAGAGRPGRRAAGRHPGQLRTQDLPHQRRPVSGEWGPAAAAVGSWPGWLAGWECSQSATLSGCDPLVVPGRR